MAVVQLLLAKGAHIDHADNVRTSSAHRPYIVRAVIALEWYQIASVMVIRIAFVCLLKPALSIYHVIWCYSHKCFCYLQSYTLRCYYDYDYSSLLSFLLFTASSKYPYFYHYLNYINTSVIRDADGADLCSHK